MQNLGSSKQLTTAPQRAVKCKVKWFNTTKGFGFVAPLNGTEDAFVHISALIPHNLQGLPEGASITCDLDVGERGLQVTNIIDLGPAPVLENDNFSCRFVLGTVKFFNNRKGFGFATPDDGGTDIFVHMKALEKSGLGALQEGQRVRLKVLDNDKGPTAEGLQILTGETPACE